MCQVAARLPQLAHVLWRPIPPYSSSAVLLWSFGSLLASTRGRCSIGLLETRCESFPDQCARLDGARLLLTAALRESRLGENRTIRRERGLHFRQRGARPFPAPNPTSGHRRRAPREPATPRVQVSSQHAELKWSDDKGCWLLVRHAARPQPAPRTLSTHERESACARMRESPRAPSRLAPGRCRRTCLRPFAQATVPSRPRRPLAADGPGQPQRHPPQRLPRLQKRPREGRLAPGASVLAACAAPSPRRSSLVPDRRAGRPSPLTSAAAPSFPAAPRRRRHRVWRAGREPQREGRPAAGGRGGAARGEGAARLLRR